jgi:hypothetical protein
MPLDILWHWRWRHFWASWGFWDDYEEWDEWDAARYSD